jgi:hypothetical protein
MFEKPESPRPQAVFILVTVCEEKGDDFDISERQFGSFSQSIRLSHRIDVEISPQASRRVFLPLCCPKPPPRRRNRVISRLNRDSHSPP